MRLTGKYLKLCWKLTLAPIEPSRYSFPSLWNWGLAEKGWKKREIVAKFSTTAALGSGTGFPPAAPVWSRGWHWSWHWSRRPESSRNSWSRFPLSLCPGVSPPNVVVFTAHKTQLSKHVKWSALNTPHWAQGSAARTAADRSHGLCLARTKWLAVPWSILTILSARPPPRPGICASAASPG